MSANSQLRSAIEQLMGTCSSTASPDLKYTDPGVCKLFLLGCCPHDVLAGTRMELGECPLLHSHALRRDYEQSGDDQYLRQAHSKLGQFIRDADRRTAAAERRLEEQGRELETPELVAKRAAIAELERRIEEGVKEAEQLGSSGEVDASLSLLERLDEWRAEKAAAEAEYKRAVPPATAQQQKLRVCDVCGSYLGAADGDRRLADHFGGRLHLGFIRLREGMKRLEERVEEMEETRRRRGERSRRHEGRRRDRRSRSPR